MYSFRPCTAPGCRKPAFAEEPTCVAHAPDPESLLAETQAGLRSMTEIRNQNFSGARFSNLDLSGKSFIACSFMGSTLSGVLFTGARFRICFFDGSDISSCDFSHLDAQFSSFGGARIVDSSFEHSELIHLNFSGARIEECTFDNSNLYDSRFIKTELITTDFIDCDLKRVYLIPAEEVGVSYRYSNTMEAIRDMEHLYQ